MNGREEGSKIRNEMKWKAGMWNTTRTSPTAFASKGSSSYFTIIDFLYDIGLPISVSRKFVRVFEIGFTFHNKYPG